MSHDPARTIAGGVRSSDRFLPRLRPTILTGFLGLLLATVVAIGGVAYVETERALEQLVQQHLDAVARATTSELRRLLDPAPRILDELAVLHQRQLLPDHPQALGEAYVERMRQHEGLGWLGYADRAERSFVGGTRSAEQGLRWYRAHPDVGGGVPVERSVDEAGHVRPLPPSSDEPYDATTRGWFTAALDAPGIRWNEPYRFTDGAWGISVTRGVERDGQVVGVILADFFLSDLTTYLEGLRVGETGQVVLVTAEGALLGDFDEELAQAVAAGRREGTRVIARHGEPHRLTFRPIRLAGGLSWHVAMVVPERELTGVARDNARRTLWLGLLALVVALVLAGLFATRISREIRQMSADVARISRLELTDRSLPRSFIREVAAMGQAIDTMKGGLRSFARYVPVGLVRQLLDEGREARLGAEERELTIVFSDIAGFTPLVESTEPAVVVEALGDYLAEMNRAIDATGGTVCQYLGDGILAFWGAPQHQADHALRACRGALAMRDASARMVHDAPRSGRPPLPTRIGVNTGEVLVGNIGAPERFNYAAVGDAVNTASRIEGMNKRYGTRLLVGERTAALVADHFVMRPIDCVRAKGKQQALRVVELLGERGAVSAADESLAARYAEAFDQYTAGDFARALAGFEALSPDPPSAELAARCRQLLAEPPVDWDGVWTLHTK